MLTFLLLTILFASTSASPIDPATSQDGPTTETTTQPDQIEANIQKDVLVLSYIQNFKNVMTDYVRSQYNNLTTNEIEKVKDTIEKFLTSFAKDLRDVIQEQHNSSLTQGNGAKTEDRSVGNDKKSKAIEDGLSDAQFDEITARLRVEFPQITEGSAHEIVYRLRKNLLATRQKLDGIIRDSQRAQEMYSLVS